MTGRPGSRVCDREFPVWANTPLAFRWRRHECWAFIVLYNLKNWFSKFLMCVRWMWTYHIFILSYLHKFKMKSSLHHSIQRVMNTWPVGVGALSKLKPLASRLAATVTWGDMETGCPEPLAFNHTAQKMKFSFGINKYPHMMRTGRSSIALDRCSKWPSVALSTFRSERRVFVWAHAKKKQGISNYTENQFFFFFLKDFTPTGYL